MTFQDVLNAVAKGGSDYAAAKKLGVGRGTFSKYRNGIKTPSEDTMIKMSELTDIPVGEIYFAVMVEKCHIPEAREYLSTLAA